LAEEKPSILTVKLYHQKIIEADEEEMDIDLMEEESYLK
jgi:hypothetical protein